MLGDTYDATRIVVEMIDEFENVLTYGSETVEINTDDKLSVIGPAKVSLIGGSIGIYVRTRGKTGKAKLTISSNHFPDIELSINIKKGILET